MRTSYEQPTGSATPIYDSLYAEYRRLFRALPGDRTGEEELRFTGFEPAHGGGGATVGGAGGWQGYVRHFEASATATAPASAFAGHAHGAHGGHGAHTSMPGHHPHPGYAGHYGYGGQSRALPAALPPAR
ncbi:hypothetical protein [Streptomyces sp. 6N223]|uniref:hypothetical protein n=1 Tax=Streptomyces sp. 6N223 TaxID=3457412 RepID=UPI003FD185B6